MMVTKTVTFFLVLLPIVKERKSVLELRANPVRASKKECAFLRKDDQEGFNSIFKYPVFIERISILFTITFFTRLSYILYTHGKEAPIS